MMETMAFHAVHPGAIRKEVPPQRIQKIVAGKRAISPETALRIGRSLGNGAKLWLTMQPVYDLRQAEIAHGLRSKRRLPRRE
jgi:addiction module HigA family antidote